MNQAEVDLKKTVNLPKTDFPMKANLPQNEPKLLARWKSEGLYEQIRAARAGAEKYILHDGPPYANGNIHLGHAFNKILKDFVVKSKTMAGFDSPYVPGWDCHGLPIEIKVDGQLGGKKAGMKASEIRAACRKYAQKYVDLQKADFERLGILGDWDHPYLTMAPEYQATIAQAFVDFLKEGYVYKGLKPVNWCIHDRTALAEAEVEYENHSSPSIWVRFALTSDPAQIDSRLAGRKVWGLIWTTTPWTIPANMAIAFHPTFVYDAIDVEGEVYLIANALAETTATNLGWKNWELVASFPGKQLDGTVFKHPFLERDSRGILGDHVTLEQGTGAVHTAPGHGQEDYVVGRQYGIETYCPVDAAGRFFRAEGAPGVLPDELIGKTVWEGNPIVIDILKKHNALAGQAKIEHSYPHCWRCHNPTIFRATEQWFIGMERNDLRQRALAAIRGVKWMPAWGEQRIYNMIAERPDWCISRQRIWGVPIIAFYCEGCAEPYTEHRVLQHVVDLFRQHTADVWYEKSAAELMGEGVQCKCGGTSFRKETDILDVWFDSGSSHLAVLGHSPELPWPSNLYLEGGDQYRGWFHSSLLVGVGLKGNAPYRECATNGWTLDKDGRAMSKSLGNVIEPEKIINQVGAEVLRLWVASVEFNEDVRLSDEILTRLTEAYRKLRNTFRYALGNLDGFNPSMDALPVNEMETVDVWILAQTRSVVEECLGYYKEFQFHRLYRRIYDFATTDLSAVYFSIIKDRLYTTAPKSRGRRSAQTTLYRLNDALVRLLAPILSFTSEEAWTYMKHSAEAPASVHLALFPSADEVVTQAEMQSHANLELLSSVLTDVREDVMREMEEARNSKLIKADLEAQVQFGGEHARYADLQNLGDALAPLFVVSQVKFADGNAPAVSIARAEGLKCERCWKYTTDVGSDANYPTICKACAEAVTEIVNG